MDIALIGFFISFVGFFFSIYVLTNDDIVVLRKSLSLDAIFDISFVLFLISIFFARLFFVLFHFSNGYLNPLVFFVVPYFPGLSVAGGLAGGLLYCFWLLRNKKNPLGRLFDFFSISFIFSFSLGSFLFFLLNIVHEKKTFYGFIIPLSYVFLFIFLARFILPIQRRGELKDGSVGCMALSSFAVITFLFDLFFKKKVSAFFVSAEDIFLFGIFLLGLVLLFHNEKLIFKFKRKSI